ncbi:MAG TPA: ankyrin repeat domain-containing protein, partial [Candidatus Babeliales bacterium]|nr:ankyrin repeat domain-containing protein [Candidatus Babeliales bacterium]
ADHGHTAIVTALIAAGANINATTKSGRTALMWATKNDYTDTVAVLMAAGANRKTQREPILTIRLQC